MNKPIVKKLRRWETARKAAWHKPSLKEPEPNPTSNPKEQKEQTMKTEKISKLALAVAIACFAVSGARGVTLNVGLSDSLAIGDVINGIQAGGQEARDVIMVNNLLTVALNTQSSALAGDVGDLYQRSGNVFSPLPAATATGAISANGVGSIPDNSVALLDITLTSSFRYLVAAYDGPNGGVEVWDIAGIAAGSTISIPRYAEPIGVNGQLQQSSRYLMTGWSLLNPGGNSLPDGGTTALLLGTALAGLGVLKRRIG